PHCSNPHLGTSRMSHVVPPSVRLTAFSCPHCSAFTTQFWYDLLATQVVGEKPVPFIPTAEDRQRFANDTRMDRGERETFLKIVDELLAGLVFLDSKDGRYSDYPVLNLHISKCYHCKKF